MRKSKRRSLLCSSSLATAGTHAENHVRVRTASLYIYFFVWQLAERLATFSSILLQTTYWLLQVRILPSSCGILRRARRDKRSLDMVKSFSPWHTTTMVHSWPPPAVTRSFVSLIFEATRSSRKALVTRVSRDPVLCGWANQTVSALLDSLV